MNPTLVDCINSVASNYATTSPIERTKGAAKDGTMNATLTTWRAHIVNLALYQPGKTKTASTAQMFVPWVKIRVNMTALTKTQNHPTTLAHARMEKYSTPMDIHVERKRNAKITRNRTAGRQVKCVLLKSGEPSASAPREKFSLTVVAVRLAPQQKQLLALRS